MQAAAAAAGYLRWAATGQPDTTGRGWEAIEAAAAAAGLELSGWYVDAGVSGLTPFEERPGGMALLQSAAKGEFTVVLVASLDRIGREAQVVNNAVAQLTAAGVKVQSISEGGMR